MQRHEFNERDFFVPLPDHMIGEDGRGMRHIPWHIVVDRLNRFFGPTKWTLESMGTPKCICEEQRSDKKWTVAYRTRRSLTIEVNGERVTKEASGAFTATQGDRVACHEMAAMACESIAIKRCARNFGPAFGLQLYDGRNDWGKLPVKEKPRYATFNPKAAPQEEVPRVEVEMRRSEAPGSKSSDETLASIDDEISRICELMGDFGLRGRLSEKYRKEYDIKSIVQLNTQSLGDIRAELKTITNSQMVKEYMS